MVKASWNGTVIAESDQTVVVDGNHYFPRSAIVSEHFRDSATTSVCGWKGTARYHDIVVGDDVNADAAWYYPEPKDTAANIKDHIAFWKGVTVS